MNMIEMMLASLPYQSEFESLKSSIRYGADPTVYIPSKVRELIYADAARQSEFRRKRSEKHGEERREAGKRGEQGKGIRPDMAKEPSRACFVCGNTDHINKNCPEKKPVKPVSR